ncbi:MAG: preprotein translocase subunit SecA [Verrucomicrobia bacterium]|nr:preprotein translocase subunit SecA [Verrucomicrobiota bacterium]
MIQWLIPNFIGNRNERELRRLRGTVDRINEIERALQREDPGKLLELTDGWRRHLARYHPLDVPPRRHLGRMDEAGISAIAERIRARMDALRGEFPQLPREVVSTPEGIGKAVDAFRQTEGRFGKARDKYLSRILPEAYAVVKNAARRLCGREFVIDGHPRQWDMVHFDVQLTGGVALHHGMIAEMQTGEGKTLVATLPVYLNALAGLGVHVVTVNDYLAKRDSQWMGKIFEYLGLSVGCILSDMSPDERREAYSRDITYGTNAEFGFDYLRDHGTSTRKDDQVQRGHHFAIIDEVDSILIDDARTPLIISGPSNREPNAMEADRQRVEQLVKRQTALCNRLAGEAAELLESGDVREAGLALLKLKLGQPRNRQFLRMMENPEVRRLLEKTELDHQQGAFRKDILRLKEQLYFVVDEKSQDADLMENGRRFLAPDDPESFTLPDLEAEIAAIDDDPSLDSASRTAAMAAARNTFDARAARIHGISQLLKAWCLYKRDVHYVVKDDKIVIVDESTGREMPGRRWSDGLHQAVEIKERVSPESETRTYATITIQNYFRLYGKLAGMTGTASTAAAEFHDIYRLDVLTVPTNRPNRRTDEPDQVYRTRNEKYTAAIERIRKAHANGQPVLVGTASVEASATLSRMLQRAAIPHTVLNAKNHASEAEIIARAGERGAVTVSTNMAGRGTDIKLADGIAELGGLLVIGTERHPSRRVDRQLRGRCARQGDPGRSQFFLSLEDDLLRNHASPDSMAAVIERAETGGTGRRQDLGGLVESAQLQVEQRDYKARKRVLDFDDVMNLQREILYGLRDEILSAGDSRAVAHDLIANVAESGNGSRRVHDASAPWNGPDAFLSGMSAAEACAAYDRDVTGLPHELLEEMERHIILDAIDHGWRDHLEDMDELREGVYLRAQGQRDPLQEYKSNGFALFESMMDAVRRTAVRHLFRNAIGMAAMLARANEPDLSAKPAVRLECAGSRASRAGIEDPRRSVAKRSSA